MFPGPCGLHMFNTFCYAPAAAKEVGLDIAMRVVPAQRVTGAVLLLTRERT